MRLLISVFGFTVGVDVDVLVHVDVDGIFLL
jgi:hypothetical protein